ncbi:tautomerase family protein [Spirosoma flavum]|uniref:Tautomerase family protein n=1 Tax=Spirosoma flavum TaxID=2048557 RepID=A0ABW6ARN2_9BACT
MPLITVTLLKGKSAAHKRSIGDAIHQSLVKSGVSSEDRFQRIIELDEENFIYNPTYPDLTNPRSADFIIIEILFSVGRSVKVKRQILADLMLDLDAIDINLNDVMVSFQETAWENWAFANGVILHA